MAFSVRNMQHSDIPAMLEIKKELGWNQILPDLKFLVNNYPKHCLVAEIDGVIAGTAGAITYEDKIAWINTVMVRAPFRGRGIALTMVKALLDSLSYVNYIKLDSTSDGYAMYSKMGFADEWEIIGYELEKKAPPPMPDDVVAIQKEDLATICEMDRKMFGFDRSKMLMRLYEELPEVAIKIEKNGIIEGFCLGRFGRTHRRIGPIIAKSEELAIKLLTASAYRKDDRKVILDTIATHKEFGHALLNMGFKPQRILRRMYYGKNPDPINISNYFVTPGGEYG